MLSPSNLKCEYVTNPIGLDVRRPRFSWALGHESRGRTQSAYRIHVASSEEGLLENRGDVWDTGKVESNRSVNVEYDGKPLASRHTYSWKVKWWDDRDEPSSYSEPAIFEVGLLEPQ